MYCRPQGYPSPHLIVLIRYHSALPPGAGLVPLCELVYWCPKAPQIGVMLDSFNTTAP